MSNINTYKIIAIYGPSGSGKNKVLKDLLKYIPNSHHIIASTTRKPRIGEIAGTDYHYLTENDFTQKVIDKSMIEATVFNNWWYGTTFDELRISMINIGIFNIDAIKCLEEDDRLTVIPLLIKATEKTRLLRILKREDYPDCTEVCRRFLADQKDFEKDDFKSYFYLNNDQDTFNDNKNIINSILHELQFNTL